MNFYNFLFNTYKTNKKIAKRIRNKKIDKLEELKRSSSFIAIKADFGKDQIVIMKK